jgi:hypothetical protein
MDKIDIELLALKQRIDFLEEKKKLELEKEIEKKENALNIIKKLIDEKKKQIQINAYSKSSPFTKFQDKEKVDMLEPIYNILQNIQERLEILENKN